MLHYFTSTYSTAHNHGVQSLSSWPEFLVPSSEKFCALVHEISVCVQKGKWADALDFVNSAISEPESQLGDSENVLRRALLLTSRSAILVALSEPGSCQRAVEDAEQAVAFFRAHNRGPTISVMLVRALLRESLARTCFNSSASHNSLARSLLREAQFILAQVRLEVREEALEDAGAAFFAAGGSSDISSIDDCEDFLRDLSIGQESGGKRGAVATLSDVIDLRERVEGALAQLSLATFEEEKEALEKEESKGSEDKGAEGSSGGGVLFLALERWLKGEPRIEEAAVGREKSDVEDDESNRAKAAAGEVVSSSKVPPSSPPSSFTFLVGREYSEGVRGVHLRCDVDAECEVLSVGEEYILTVEKAKQNHPLCQRLSRAGIDRELSAAKHCYLAVYILCTRGDPASHFSPYYALLPSSFPSMPLFWGPEELSWLSGSYLLEQVEDRRRNIQLDYRLITGRVPELGGLFTLDEFLWARMIVASRNFGITVDGLRTDAMVPYADMLNHLRPRQTRWQYDSSRRAFLIVTLQPLSAGQQVFDSYGKKCNSRFLLNYGFTVQRNADDDTGQFHNELRLSLTLPSPAQDPWHWHKAERLGGSIVRNVRISTFYEYEGTQEAFSFLRFAYAKGSWHGSTGAPGGSGGGGLSPISALNHQYNTPALHSSSDLARCPHALDEELVDLGLRPIPCLSCANEAAVLEQIAKLCSTQLAKYERTLEADEEELGGPCAPPLFSNRHNALTILAGEKTIARFFVELHRRASPLLLHTDASVAASQAEVFLSMGMAALPSKSAASLEKDTLLYFKAVVIPLLQRRVELEALANESRGGTESPPPPPLPPSLPQAEDF